MPTPAQPRHPARPTTRPTEQTRPRRTALPQIHCTHVWHQGALSTPCGVDALRLRSRLRWGGMTSTRRCTACLTPLPADAPARKRFCDTSCQRRAQSRRRRGLPEQDQPVAAVDLARLAKTDRQLAGKDRTIARLRAGRQADRDRVRAAEVAAAAAERRAERAIESMGHDVNALTRKKATLADALQRAQRQRAKDRQTIEQLHETLDKYRAEADQQVPAQTIRRQWEALAVRIARQASGNAALPLAGLDQEVVTTWQQLRQQNPPTGAGKTTGKTTRRARPATPPRRRNR